MARRVTRNVMLTAVIVCATVAIYPQILAQGTSKEAPATGLIPCLAVAADFQPIWRTQTFPSSGREMVAVFRLAEDESYATLTSNWIAIDVGDAAAPNTQIATGDLELKGMHEGKLRYSQENPIPPGRYRLDVLADGKPWKSAELTVAPDESPISMGSADDLFPLTPGRSWTYDVTIEVNPAAKVTVRNIDKPDADGKLRATDLVGIGEVNDRGALVETMRNGKPFAIELWKLDEGGLVALSYHPSDGSSDYTYDPPMPILPRPQGTSGRWTYTPKDKAFTATIAMWGPLPITMQDGATTPGYLVVIEQPNEMAITTVERQFVPQVGMVRQVITAAVGGKLVARHTSTPATPGYRIVANPALRGRLARLVVKFPQEASASGTHVQLTATGSRTAIAGGYGDQTLDAIPGRYDVVISGKRVPVDIQSKHDTVVDVGVLRVFADASTRFEVLDIDKKTQLFNGFGEQQIGLPTGTYYLRIMGQVEQIKIERDKLTEF